MFSFYSIPMAGKRLSILRGGCQNSRARRPATRNRQAHHTLEEYLDRYIAAARIDEDKKGPLFRSTYLKTGRLTTQALPRDNAFRKVQRRARKAGIRTKIGCHTFRATGITIYLTNGGDLEKAQQMAAHESPRTTKLYDRRNDVVSLDEVEKMVF